MDRTELFELVAPSVVHLVCSRQDQRVASGTGFIVAGRLVSAGHNLVQADGHDLRVQQEQGQSDNLIAWDPANMGKPYLGFSEANAHDFAILDFPEVANHPSLAWADKIPKPGEEVCAFGYPFEDQHLTMSSGFVSAVFKSGVATLIKIDMSVNASLSGGPLVRASDGTVLGMITRKATGLTAAFDQLERAMDQNIQLLAKAAPHGIELNGFNPLHGFLGIQNQMRVVAREMRRSANVGIGYAVWNRPLREEGAFGR